MVCAMSPYSAGSLTVQLRRAVGIGCETFMRVTAGI